MADLENLTQKKEKPSKLQLIPVVGLAFNLIDMIMDRPCYNDNPDNMKEVYRSPLYDVYQWGLLTGMGTLFTAYLRS